MANGVQLAADNFTRANENPLANGNWTTVTGLGALQIASNLCECTATGGSGCAALWTGTSFSADHYAECVVNSLTNPTLTDIVLMVRCDSTNANAYEAFITNTVLTLYSRVTTTATQIGQATAITWAAGDIVRLTAVGTQIIVTRNQNIILNIASTTIASGTPGLKIFTTNAITDGKVSLWSAGNAAGDSAGVWTKQGVVIKPLSGDIASTLKGTSNNCMLYEGSAQLISPNIDGKVFKMWFQGGANVYYAEANAAIGPWTRQVAAVLSSVSLLRVIHVGSTYYGFVNNGPTGPWQQIDRYTSTDGLSWGAATNTNVLPLGAGGTWDASQLFYLSVLDTTGGTWTALYAAADASGNQATGNATSTNLGVTWVKAAGNPIFTNRGLPQTVTKVGSTYYGWMTRINIGTKTANNGLASLVRMQTTDFLTWTGETFALQCDHVWEGLNANLGEISVPSVIELNGTTYMFYSATPDGNTISCYQICLAQAPYSVAQLSQGQEYFATYKQTASDTFLQADENPLSSSGAWVTQGGRIDPRLVSHLVEPTATGSAAGSYRVGTYANDQYSEITVSALTASNALLYASVRAATGNTNAYIGQLQGAINASGNFFIYRVASGVTTQLTQGTITPQVGDVIRMSAIGNVISLFQNGGLILQAIDNGATAIASGQPAFFEFATTAITNTKISAWAGGNANQPLPAFAAGNAGALSLRRRRRRDVIS